jgi:hypothetical protein
MPAERVVIDIEVNSDIATIEATREALDRLTNAQRRYNRERDRGGSVGDGGGSGGSGGGGGGGGGGNRGGRGGSSRPRRGRYDGLGGQVFDFRGDMGKGIAAYGKLLGLVNKLSAIALPLMMAALGGIALAFKAGTYFINMYKAAMASLASALAVGFVALTTFLAAQKEFSAVQNSPAYSEGANNTTDRIVAAGQAMSMFTDNARLAVIGSKGLQSAFSTLSKVKPVDGATTAAFEGLMNVVAGSGGDLEKGAGKLAEFLAAVQKKGSLAGGAQAAKDLGPDFEKIVKEASALGIKTSDEFLKAAASGQLGETFATKYAGTLDALNNTVMGRFKSAVTSIKGLLTDLGGQYLGETGGAIARLQQIIESFIIRLNFVMQDFSLQGKMGGFLDKVEKGTNALIVLMTKYLGATPNIFQFFNSTITSMRDFFDGMQDWMRQFREAGELINEYFFKPMFSALGQNFTRSMTDLSEVIERNKDSITGFAIQISKTLTAMGKYGDTVRRLFMGAMPLFEIIFKMVELFFRGLTAFGKAALTISNVFNKLGPLGKIAGALVNVAALYSLFALATRFFKVFGTMFGKNMKQTGTMNVQAGVVNVGGSPMTPGGTPTGGGGGRFAGRGGRFLQGVRGMMPGMGTMLASGGLMLGGSLLSGQGDRAGGYDSVGGSALKSAGLAAQGTGGLMMMGASASSVAAPVAIGALAYGAGSYIGGKFNDDSVKSRGTAALGGAAAGAGIGAGIGAALTAWGGPLAVVGAGAGAAIGAVIGGVSGYLKAGKQRKDTRKAAETLVGEYSTAVTDAMAGGNVDELLKARTDMIAARGKLVGENADPAYAAKALEKYNKEFEALNTKINNYSGAANIAQKYLGVGAEQLNAFAKDKGINIEDQMLNLRDVIKILGKDTAEQARLMKAAWANIGANASGASRDFFTDKANAQEQSKLVNSTQSRILGGDISQSTMDNYLQQLRDYNIAAYGDVAGLALTGSTLEEELTTGSFKDLSEEMKTYLRTTAGSAGLTGTSLLKNISGTDLAELFAGSKALLDQGLGSNADPTKLDPTKLMGYISSQQALNPQFLANLINAQQELDPVLAEQKTRQVMSTGSSAGMYALDPEEARVRSRYSVGADAVPAAQTSNPAYVNTNIYASVLDRGTIVQIEAAIAKALREQKERGANTGTTRES